MQTPHLFAILEPAGLPALRVISVMAALIFAGIGTYIYRHRHQLFDHDPQLAEYQDGPGVRHIRLELVFVIWGALMLVILATLYGIGSARSLGAYEEGPARPIVEFRLQSSSLA